MIGQASLFQPDATLPLRKRVEVQIITVAQARYALEKFHYLHRVRTGRQINYAVLIDGVVDGVITYAYPMTPADFAGVANAEILEFARLYLHSNIPHSATCAIGKTLKCVVTDWTRLYPDASIPRLVVSWSDTEYHKGTIYKAANFVWLKRSAAHAWKNEHRANTYGLRRCYPEAMHVKDCWIYTLR